MGSRGSFLLLRRSLAHSSRSFSNFLAGGQLRGASLALPQASGDRDGKQAYSASIGLAAISATAAAYWACRPSSAIAEAAPAAADELLEPIKTDPYKIPIQTRGLPKEFVLYQYEVCPFCCKVKAFLDFYKIPYKTVEVNPLTKGQLKWTPYKKVPVAVIDGDVITDSTAIVSQLAAELDAQGPSSQSAPAPDNTSSSQGSSSSSWLPGWLRRESVPEAVSAAVSSGAQHSADEERWRRWVDDRLVKVLTVNLYRSASEAFQTFDYLTSTGQLGFLERHAARIIGAGMMWGVSGKLKKKYNIEGEPRSELYASAEEWVAGLHSQDYMGGSKPNLADISAFGVIRSITGTPSFMDLMHNTSISDWYARMMEVVGADSRTSKS